MSNRQIQWEKARTANVDPLKPIIVVDIGGTRAKFGLVANGKPLDHYREVPIAGIRTETPLENLKELITSFASSVPTDFAAVILTVPGFIDRDFDRILQSNNVPELEGHLLATELTEILGRPVVLERDTFLLLQGECIAGAAAGVNDVAGIFFGTGIGAAYLQEGQPFRGGGWAMEIGHVPMTSTRRDLAGARYPNLEVCASGRALAEIANKYDVPLVSVFSSTENVAGLDREIEELVRLQAFAVSGLLATLSPSVVLIGGGVVSMEGYPWERLVEIVANHAPLPSSVLLIDIRRAELGWQSVLYGAAAALRDNLTATVR